MAALHKGTSQNILLNFVLLWLLLLLLLLFLWSEIWRHTSLPQRLYYVIHLWVWQRLCYHTTPKKKSRKTNNAVGKAPPIVLSSSSHISSQALTAEAPAASRHDCFTAVKDRRFIGSFTFSGKQREKQSETSKHNCEQNHLGKSLSVFGVEADSCSGSVFSFFFFFGFFSPLETHLAFNLHVTLKKHSAIY